MTFVTFENNNPNNDRSDPSIKSNMVRTAFTLQAVFYGNKSRPEAL